MVGNLSKRVCSDCFSLTSVYAGHGAASGQWCRSMTVKPDRATPLSNKYRQDISTVKDNPSKLHLARTQDLNILPRSFQRLAAKLSQIHESGQRLLHFTLRLDIKHLDRHHYVRNQ